jgi:hypothetical protein
VTSRAARRYVEILREADMPVESVRGPDGGYQLGRGVRPPPPAGPDPVTTLEEHLGVGWQYAVRVTVDAPLVRVASAIPRTMGRLEAVDATTTRLIGSTRNVTMYAEQLAMLPAPFRLDEGEEVRAALAALAALADRVSAVARRSPAAP